MYTRHLELYCLTIVTITLRAVFRTAQIAIISHKVGTESDEAHKLKVGIVIGTKFSPLFL